MQLRGVGERITSVREFEPAWTPGDMLSEKERGEKGED